MLARSLTMLSFAALPFLTFAASDAGAAPSDEVVVLLRADSRSAAVPEALGPSLVALGLEPAGVVAAPSARRGFAILRLRGLRAGFDAAAAAATLRGSPGVLAAIPNHRLRLYPTLPNDPMRPLQWHVESGDSADVELPSAWDTARGDTGTVIGIMDTGVDLGHPDLASKIWTNWIEASGAAGVDDDGNGWTDDVHGWDFGNDDADPNPEPTMDPIGLDIGFHGTFVAGIAAAATHNGAGISGASWNCRVMPLKVSNAAGEITSDAVAGAFAYATDFGIAVLNMSLGGPGDPGVPEFFQVLVDAANAAGVMSVAAAGNDGVDVPSYPAANDGVLSVAATNDLRQRAEFSNFGSWVDVAAPGAYLWSSICRNYVVDDTSQLFYYFFFEWDFVEPYMRGDGTSFACPLAAGVAALVRSLHPQLTPQQVADHLIATGDVIAFDQPIGPKVNAHRAVTQVVLAAEPPAAPLALRLDGAVPHPIRGAGVLRFALPSAGEASLEVYDLAGRRVRTLERGALGAGPHQRAWNGTDDDGRRLPDGVYLIRLASGGRSVAARAVLLRR